MTTTARLGIDIVAFNRTNQAFASAQRGLMQMERTAKRMKGAFAFVGLAVSVERFARALVDVAIKTDPVATKFRQIDESWNNFALRVAENGLSAGMIDFANSVQKVTSGANDLDEIIGRLMGGAARQLGIFLESVADVAMEVTRLIEALGDQFNYLSQSILGLPNLPSWILNPSEMGHLANQYFMADLDRMMYSNAEPGKGHLPFGMTTQ